MSRPIVVIPSCTKSIGGLTFDTVGRKYSAAVAEVAECQPLLVPLGQSMADIGAVLDVADGILLSGSLSNVEPRHYSDELPLDPATVDRDRDALTLPLIRTAIERKIPLFAICRGFQEFNVALGGTLHQAVHEVDGHNDHREPTDEDFEIKFGPKHQVRLEGELKTRCMGRASTSSQSRSSPKHSPRTASSRPFVRQPDMHSLSAFSGILNGGRKTILHRSPSSAASEKPPEAAPQRAAPHERHLYHDR
jgi:gamma-glutamyl-gamma-aminobutyrate hydrolase PuuD